MFDRQQETGSINTMKPILLPVEIIARIIQYLIEGENVYKRRDFKALVPVLQVSPTFRVEAERILYAHIHLRTPKEVVGCFTTICKRPHIGRAVRYLSVHLHLNSSESPSLWQILGFGPPVNEGDNPSRNKNLGKVLKSFGLLVSRTLRKLYNLQDYSLSMGSPHGRDEAVFAVPWLPTNAPFQLRRFAVDLNLSQQVVAFLKSQSSIENLFATHFNADRVNAFLPSSPPVTPPSSNSSSNPTAPPEPIPAPLSGDVMILDGSQTPASGGQTPNLPPPDQPRLPPPSKILPRLQTIVSTSSVAARFVPNRPVRRVCVRDTRRGALLNRLSEAIPEFAKSYATVKHFDVTVWDLQTLPDHLWGPLTMHLPHLTSLVIRPLSSWEESTYDKYMANAFCEPLSTFRDLKQIVVSAPTARALLRDVGFISEIDHSTAPITFHANINAQLVIGAPGPMNPNVGHPMGPGIGGLMGPFPLGPMQPHPAPPGPPGADHPHNHPPNPPLVVHGPPPPPNFQGPHDPPPIPPPPQGMAALPFGGVLGGLFGGMGGFLGFGGFVGAVPNGGPPQQPTGPPTPAEHALQPAHHQMSTPGPGSDGSLDGDAETDDEDALDTEAGPDNNNTLPAPNAGQNLPPNLPPFIQQLIGAMGNIPGVQQVHHAQPANGGAPNGNAGDEIVEEHQTFVSTFVLHHGPPPPAGPAAPPVPDINQPGANDPGAPEGNNIGNILAGGPPPALFNAIFGQFAGQPPPQPDNANPPAGGNANGPQLPPPNLPPMNIIHQTITGFVDPVTGVTISDESSRNIPRAPPDPRRIEALERGMKSLHARELAILEKWRLACPKLSMATFDLDGKMKNVWTWKKAGSGHASKKADLAKTEGDDHRDENMISTGEQEDSPPELGGRWESEFINLTDTY